MAQYIIIPDYGGALDDGEVREVLERVDEDPEGQARLFQQAVRLGDLGEGAAEDVGAAVDVVPHLGLRGGGKKHIFLKY